MATKDHSEQKAALTFTMTLETASKLDAFVAAAKAEDRKHHRPATTRSAVVEAALVTYFTKHARERRG